MHFLLQLNCAELPWLAPYAEMPRKGTLFFFFDTIFAPVNDKTKGGCRVIYVGGDVSQCPPRKTPKMPEVSEKDMVSWWSVRHPTSEYDKWNIADFQVHESCDAYTSDNANIADHTASARVRSMRECQNTARQVHYANDENHDDLNRLTLFHCLFGGDSNSTRYFKGISLLRVREEPWTGQPYGPLVFKIPRESLAAGRFEDVYMIEGE